MIAHRKHLRKVQGAGKEVGLVCRWCGSNRLRVVYTRGKPGQIIRRRECVDCKKRITTKEYKIPS